jgi:hypothetical protein
MAGLCGFGLHAGRPEERVYSRRAKRPNQARASEIIVSEHGENEDGEREAKRSPYRLRG